MGLARPYRIKNETHIKQKFSCTDYRRGRDEHQLLSSLALSIWWEVIMTVDAPGLAM